MTRAWTPGFVFAASILFFNLSHQLCAQAITAKVAGTVTDPSGGAVPAAALTLTHAQTGQTRTTQTNAVLRLSPHTPVGVGWLGFGYITEDRNDALRHFRRREESWDLCRL